MDSKKRFLFVCLGNIVRSPLAEHLFREKAMLRFGQEQFEIDSAGTSAYHAGDPPDRRMRSTAANHGLEYDGFSRQITLKDLAHFDHILVMDQSNYAHLMAMAVSEEQRGKIRMLSDFDPQARGADIPDPYYSGPDGFEHVYRIVERAVDGLVEALAAESEG